MPFKIKMKSWFEFNFKRKQVKMITFLLLICTFGLVLAEEPIVDRPIDTSDAPESDYNMLSLVRSFEEATEMSLGPHEVYLQDSVEFNPNVIEVLDNMNNELKTPSDAHDFIQANGIDKIVIPLLMNIDPENSEPVLLIVKRLFELVPQTVSTVIPYSFLEKMLFVFESHMSPKITRHAVDIITLWLLKNPGAQTHVIKVRGLQQFYSQLAYLDMENVRKMLNLFVKLIQEHLEIREKATEDKNEKIIQNMYIRTGLLELVATYESCTTFVTLYDAYLPVGDQLIVEIIDLIKITKQFCSDEYHERLNVINTFKNILEYVSDDTKYTDFETMGLNVTDTQRFLHDYIAEMQQRHEL